MRNSRSHERTLIDKQPVRAIRVLQVELVVWIQLMQLVFIIQVEMVLRIKVELVFRIKVELRILKPQPGVIASNQFGP